MDSPKQIVSKAQKAIKEAESLQDLKKIRQEFLGSEGSLNKMFGKIGELDPEKRADFGKNLNEAKTKVESMLEKKLANIQNANLEKELETKPIDPTAPFNLNSQYNPKIPSQKGSSHPILKEIEKMYKILESMGYIIEERRILTDDWNCFESLNIPKGHPARDLWDTFWTEDNYIPSTHTSSQQVQYMSKYKKNLENGDPIAVAIPGKCYRNEATDARHEMTFYQLEMFYIDKDIKITDMIGTMKSFLQEYFEKEDIGIHIQPSYFPFVEPGLQFMNDCVFCNGEGCNICSFTGMLEIMGCGYIHPQVLENAGIDSNIYSGFAYGPGVGRIVMLKNQIQDIRHFYSGDLKFLKQF
jgi:phenylalanyl-tRNA synthetase alpha chain